MKKNHNPDCDYLVIGHITHDVCGNSYTLGGTAAYAALCAKSLGRKACILTSMPTDTHLPDLQGIPISIKHAETITTFKNTETDAGREQFVLDTALKISIADIPSFRKECQIVHLGPVMDEIDEILVNSFPNSFIGITPQGWMRKRGAHGKIGFRALKNPKELFSKASAAVFSIEDVLGNEDLIAKYAGYSTILAVTEGYNGARIYWNGDVRHFQAPKIELVDATGAGDIFAAVFFDSLANAIDPWDAGRRAVAVASQSVTRKGLAGIPTKNEVDAFKIDIIEG